MDPYRRPGQAGKIMTIEDKQLMLEQTARPVHLLWRRSATLFQHAPVWPDRDMNPCPLATGIYPSALLFNNPINLIIPSMWSTLELISIIIALDRSH